MNTVHTISFHIIRETGRATNPRHENRFVRLLAKVGQRGLHLFEDGIIAAAGTPAHILIGGKILGFQGIWNPVWIGIYGHFLYGFNRLI